MPIAPPVMLAACLGLAALLFAEIERPVKSLPLPDLAPVVSAGEAPRAAAVFVAPSAAEFAEITARPVFAMTRRPPPPAPPPAPPPTAIAAPPPPPPAPPVAAKAITVLGIVGPPGKRIALLQAPNAPTAVSVVVGESVAGWQVTEILADRVRLKWNATAEEISFPKPGDRPAAPPPTRAPAIVNRRP
jgi:hypothetical protein